MCPHGDRDASGAASKATFVMTNMIPQAGNLNQKAWNHLEEYTRDLVRKHGRRAYVVSGPLGRGGRGKLGPADAIGPHRVVVPAECWKLIVAIPEDGGPDDPALVTADARVIAVVMPNDQNQVGEEWASFRVRPADVERRTGYRFFDRLRPDVADALRNRVDTVHVPPPTRGGRGAGRAAGPPASLGEKVAGEKVAGEQVLGERVVSMTDDDLLHTLRAAADGLLYPSESDEPFEAFRWPGSAGRTARAAVAAHEGETPEGAARERDDVPLDVQTPAAFFGPLEGGEDAGRYRALRRALEAAVRGLTVVRAGERQVAVYLIGRATDGDWVGLRTTSVET
jgi:hypothetical protein